MFVFMNDLRKTEQYHSDSIFYYHFFLLKYTRK